mmetsp:Transcript_19404/g.41348  ORF Transcript_19404/g.41348 Transcript_19404/m.41348 type:complete len:227 (-) Transcript_19404:1366-2046(-)
MRSHRIGHLRLSDQPFKPIGEGIENVLNLLGRLVLQVLHTVRQRFFRLVLKILQVIPSLVSIRGRYARWEACPTYCLPLVDAIVGRVALPPLAHIARLIIHFCGAPSASEIENISANVGASHVLDAVPLEGKVALLAGSNTLRSYSQAGLVFAHALRGPCALAPLPLDVFPRTAHLSGAPEFSRVAILGRAPLICDTFVFEGKHARVIFANASRANGNTLISRFGA